MKRPPPSQAGHIDYAHIDRDFESPNLNALIETRIRTSHDAANPGARQSALRAQLAKERLAFLQAEQRRCYQQKEQSEQTTEKHLGKRPIPLTLYVFANFLVMALSAFVGIVVATWALAIYAKDSGVLPSLDTSFLAALMVSFPIFAVAQGTKAAAGALCKSDAEKRRFFIRLCWLGFAASLSFIVGAALGFAPHASDLEAATETMNTGKAAADGFMSACKAVAPYLVVGSGLLIEIVAAAIIAHRADQMNELGRDVIQGVAPLQLVLDARIDELQAKIDIEACKAAEAQAIADLHEAKIAISIEAAQAYARELNTQYAAWATTLRQDFITQRTKKRG